MNSKLILAGALALAAAPLLAHPGHNTGAQTTQTQPMDHSQMGQGQMGQGQMMNHGQMMMGNTPANPYAEAEMRVHQKMMSAVGSNPDETWALKMIEHHRGAIETAQILLSKGRDAGLQAMARKSMAEQQKEIAQLEAWLRQNGGRTR